MIQTLIIIYIVVLLFPIIRRKRNWFTPPILMSITMTFYTVPDLLGIFFSGYKTYAKNLPFKIYTDPEFLIERFLFIQILFIITYLIAFNKFYDNKKIKRPLFQLKKENNKISYFFGLTLLILCGIATFQYIKSQGGLGELVMSFMNRNKLLEDQSFLHRISPTLMTFATIFCMRYILCSKGKHIILFLMLVFIGFFCYTSNGGRSQLVVFVLTLLCCYNYWKKNINLLSPKFYILYFALAVFIIAFQLLRYEETNALTFEDIFNNQATVFDSMAYVKTQLLIENYFDKFDHWYGYIFYFLIYIFIPRSVYPNKPHIDEGDYIYNMRFDHSDVLSDQTFINSWPPFTMGEGYANFGFVGVILFAIILALLHSYVFRLLKSSKSTLFILPIYVFIVLKFQITIFYIANLTYLLIANYVFHKLYNSFSNQIKSTNLKSIPCDLQNK